MLVILNEAYASVLFVALLIIMKHCLTEYSNYCHHQYLV